MQTTIFYEFVYMIFYCSFYTGIVIPSFMKARVKSSKLANHRA